MGIFHGVFEQSGCNQAGGVCHIYHEDSTHFVSYLANTCIIPLATVSRTTGNNEFRLVLACQLFHLIIVYTTCFFFQIIAYRLVKNAGCIDCGTMGEVAAVVEVKSHKRVSGIEASQKYGGIGLCSGVRLHIGIHSTKEFLHTFTRQILYLVYHLAAAIVTFSGQSFCILVGEIGAHGCHYLVTYEVL